MGATKSKFSVGDRVEYVGRNPEYHDETVMGFVGTVTGYSDYSNLPVVDFGSGRIRRGIFLDNLELVTPVVAPATTAIRTVTRREIVPGKVDLGECNGVEISDVRPHGIRLKTNYCFGPPSLRAAAALFNELADVLDEQQKKEAA